LATQQHRRRRQQQRGESESGLNSSGWGRDTMRPAADGDQKRITAVFGPHSYMLLFLLRKQALRKNGLQYCCVNLLLCIFRNLW